MTTEKKAKEVALDANLGKKQTQDTPNEERSEGTQVDEGLTEPLSEDKSIPDLQDFAYKTQEEIPIHGNLMLQMIDFLQGVAEKETSIVLNEKAEGNQPDRAVTTLGQNAMYFSNTLLNWHMRNINQGIATSLEELRAQATANPSELLTKESD